jgi:hypothetical protein
VTVVATICGRVGGQLEEPAASPSTEPMNYGGGIRNELEGKLTEMAVYENTLNIFSESTTVAQAMYEPAARCLPTLSLIG